MIISSDYRKNITQVNLTDLNLTYVSEENQILGANAGVYTSIWKLFLAMLFYLVMLIITFGIKVPCGKSKKRAKKKEKENANYTFFIGLFVPSLTIGALAGRIIGIIVEIISLYVKILKALAIIIDFIFQ